MNHRGHPKKPVERESLPLSQLVQNFLAQTQEEAPALFKKLGDLDLDAKNQLGGILGRFDLKKKGELDARQRLLVRRIITRLHKPTEECFILTNKILDYLDLNLDAVIDEKELALGVEILELFATAESDNDTLSLFELEMLYSVLRHLDKDSSGHLEQFEKDVLQQGLKNPSAFLVSQKQTNLLLMKLLETRYSYNV